MCLAVPGQVEQIFEDRGTRMGKVNFGGVVKNVCLAYLPDIQVGDYTIVHVGFAISQIDEDSARQTLQTFEELGLLEDELQELRETDFEESIGETRSDSSTGPAAPSVAIEPPESRQSN